MLTLRFSVIVNPLAVITAKHPKASLNYNVKHVGICAVDNMLTTTSYVLSTKPSRIECYTIKCDIFPYIYLRNYPLAKFN